MHIPGLALLLKPPSARLFALHPLDIVIIAVYFAAVLGIGFYLKRHAGTTADFFFAGRNMTAWIAGLSFVAANLGSLELMDGLRRPTSTAFSRRTGTGSAPYPRCSSWAS